MRTSNFGKGRRVTVLFRLCLAIIVSLTLAMGGMALKTEPVQAVWMSITPPNLTDNTLVECQYWEYQFTHDCSDSDTPNCCTVAPFQHYHWWVIGGVLPPGLTLDQNGLLSGYPEVGSAGNYNFAIVCTEVGCCCCPWGACGPNFAFSTPVNLTVNPFDPTLCFTQIDPTFYPVAWENAPFTMTLTATGGVGPFDWTATGLPTGLTVTDPVNGVISGIPAPGTCGIYNVTATVNDTGACCPAGNCCCCLPISRPFMLIVDCLANYAFVTYYTSACDFTVNIGSGLTQGLTQVLIDGSPETMLGGGQSASFTSVPCQSHLVTVDQVIQGTDPKTRLAVIGSNQKMVTDTDNYAYFDYRQEVLIETGSEPAGVSQPPGTGFYPIGDAFSTTAPSPVQPSAQEGIKYIFREFMLPDGSTNPNRDLWFNVNKVGQVKAKYDTYYLLQLKSEYPPVNDSSWHLKGSTATWDLALHAVPLKGLVGFLGGQLVPVNARGTHPMTGPYTQEIMWRASFMWPIIAIVLILLVIGGLCYFIYRLKAGPTRPPTTKKKAPTRKSRRQSKAKVSRQTTRSGAKKRTSPRSKRAAK
jgi:hypothetical protein